MTQAKVQRRARLDNVEGEWGEEESRGESKLLLRTKRVSVPSKNGGSLLARSLPCWLITLINSRCQERAVTRANRLLHPGPGDAMRPSAENRICSGATVFDA